MAKDSKMILIVGLGIGAYLLYKKSLAPAVPVIAPSLSTSPAVSLSSLPMDPMTAATSVTNPGDAVILSWFNQLSPANAKQAISKWPVMTTAEKAGLYDLIVKDWGGDNITTAARSQFWNDWRVKYHINDGTYP